MYWFIQEITTYQALKRISVNENKLEWWSDNRKKLPLPSEVAHEFLPAPPTSVPSEQSFSGVNLIYSDTRSRLSGDLVEKLLFLKPNLIKKNFFALNFLIFVCLILTQILNAVCVGVWM